MPSSTSPLARSADAAPGVAASSALTRMSPRFIALLGLRTALGAVSTDTYLTSLPAVAEDLATTPRRCAA